jgi:hypothetical protein
MSYVRSLVAFLVMLLAVPAFAQAEEKAPDSEAADPPKLEVVLIDSDPRDKGRALKPIEKALEARDDVKVTSEKDFLESAKERDVTLETLRKGSEREKHEKEIAAAMNDAGIEVVIVVDAIKKRRYAQAVVLGPKGRELADIRERISRLKNNKRVDKYILNEAFKVAEAEVLEYREMVAQKREEERRKAEEEQRRQAAAEAAAASESELAAKVDVEDEVSDTSNPAFTLTVSGFVGQRSFSAEAAESSYLIEHTAPLAGASAELGVRLATFGAGTLGFEAQGDYAPMSVEFVADGGDPFTVSGHHVAGRGEFAYRHRFGSAFARVGVGADAVSSTLDPNSFFTGSRYIAGRATLGGGFGQADGFLVQVNGGVLPVLANNISGQAYGETDGIGIAYTGQARISYALTNSLSMQLGYDMRLYSNSFDEPTLASSTVNTSDLIHGGTIGIGYRM